MKLKNNMQNADATSSTDTVARLQIANVSSSGNGDMDLKESFPGLEIFGDYPVPSIFFNLSDGKIIAWNKATSNLTGYADKSFCNIKDFITALIPNHETCELFKKLLFLPLQKDEVQHTSVTCVSKGGKPYVAELQVWQADTTSYPVGSRVLHLLLLASNDPVVEHLHRYSEELGIKIQQSASDLERHKQWLEMALEGSGEGLWSIDFHSGKMEFAYTNILTILGYTVDEMSNAPFSWDNLTHPDDLPEVKRRLSAHFEGKTPYYEAEYRAKAKNGQWRWILGHGRVVSRDGAGKPLEVVGTHIDIDRLKRTEEELRRSENLFRTLVENAPIGLVLVGGTGNILYTNPNFRDFFGYEQADLPDIDSWWACSQPNVNGRKVLLKELEAGSSIKTTVLCKDGLEKYVVVQCSILPDKTSFISYKDVTSQHIYERTLLKREKELHEKSEKLEEMNSALRVLLNRMNSDKEELENKVYVNIRDLVMPYVDKLEALTQNDVHHSYLNIIKTNLQNIISSFAIHFTKQSINLTPREIQIANMINEDMSNKDIAAILYISESSVEFHRHNIRKKLGLVDKKVNLKTYLRGIL